MDRYNLAFGHGPRICVGKVLPLSVLYETDYRISLWWRCKSWFLRCSGDSISNWLIPRNRGKLLVIGSSIKRTWIALSRMSNKALDSSNNYIVQPAKLAYLCRVNSKFAIHVFDAIYTEYTSSDFHPPHHYHYYQYSHFVLTSSPTTTTLFSLSEVETIQLVSPRRT